MEKSIEKVIDCYDKTAAAYAENFLEELSKKHLDRLLLAAFAQETQRPMADFGCGPGQTTRFLKNAGVEDLVGIDISPEMIQLAKQLHPDITFRRDNLLDLSIKAKSFKAAVAFYAIVHFTLDQLEIALQEIYRVLDDQGQFLFAFHIGTEKIHHDQFLGQAVDIDFYFFETETVLRLARAIGFKTIDVVEREPYVDAEYPSRRAYVWLIK